MMEAIFHVVDPLEVSSYAHVTSKSFPTTPLPIIKLTHQMKPCLKPKPMKINTHFSL
ncbi:hypothetical protein HanRHA438_Chr02g0062981 [Helianthus annuus]|nr:hypothetical protein HanRHA438_Chr02g0062981 [Helianthus annuus]